MTTPPNFRPGNGRLATDRFDFQNHLEGINPPGFTDFRHTADQIDMQTNLLNGAATVQDSFAQVASFISKQSGQGFIAVGDGYDTWHNAAGNTTVSSTPSYDPAIPSLDTLLNPIFNSIINNTVLSGYERIQRGGIVLIKAGTYIVKNTINVPPGITLIGEGFGTKIINTTNTTQALPPAQKPNITITSIVSNSTNTTVNTLGNHGLNTGDSVSLAGITSHHNYEGSWVITKTSNTAFTLNGATNGNFTFTGGTLNTSAPLFRIKNDQNRNEDAASSSNFFIFSRESRILNMVISDNFVDSTQLGDNYYLTPQNKTSSTVLNQPPLIVQELGTSFVAEKVMFMGRQVSSGGNPPSSLTTSAIALDPRGTLTGTSGFGTRLKVNECSLESFALPISFTNSLGPLDYFECINNRIRSFGLLNGDASTIANNCCILINDCIARVSNNTFYSGTANVNYVLTFNAINLPTLGLSANNSGRIIISNNTLYGAFSSAIYATGDALNPNYFKLMSYGNNPNQFAIDTYFGAPTSSLSGHNSFSEDGYGVNIYNLTSVLGGNANFNGTTVFGKSATVTNYANSLNNTITTTANYAVDSTQATTGFDNVILCNLSTSSITITLPTANVSNKGRILTFKDSGLATTGKTITIAPSGGQTIDGASNYIINAAYGRVKLACLSANGSTYQWYVV